MLTTKNAINTLITMDHLTWVELVRDGQIIKQLLDQNNEDFRVVIEEETVELRLSTKLTQKLTKLIPKTEAEIELQHSLKQCET